MTACAEILQKQRETEPVRARRRHSGKVLTLNLPPDVTLKKEKHPLRCVPQHGHTVTPDTGKTRNVPLKKKKKAEVLYALEMSMS